MKPIFILITAFFCLSPCAQAEQAVLSSFTVKKQSLLADNLAQISEHFEIAHASKTDFTIIVPAARRQEFLRLAPNAQILEADISAIPRARVAAEKITRQLFPYNPSQLSNVALPFDRITYHSVNEVQAILKNFADAYPNLAQYFEYGVSPAGNPLMGLKISDNVALDENEPELMITAATHGDEIITTEILLGLMDRLLSGNGTDPRLTKMITEHELFFIPTLNVDGFADQWRYDKGVDPNRSYPYPGNPIATPSPATAAIIDFFHSRNFTGSLDFHAFGRLVMFPWAYSFDPIVAEDYARFDLLTTSMAQTNVYTHGPIAHVIYVAKGSSCDYYYWKNKTTAVAIEVGMEKAPPVEYIERYTDDQTESTWRFIENF